MAMRLYGQKLPPLPSKTKMANRIFSDDNTVFCNEDNEDAPLLSKSGNDKGPSDIVRSLKDALSTSSHSGKDNDNDSSKISYNSIEQNRVSPSSYAKASILFPEEDHTSISTDLRMPILSLEEAGRRYNELDFTKDWLSLPGYQSIKDCRLRRDKGDTFELFITNPLHEQDKDKRRIPRSLSSNENSKYILEYKYPKPHAGQRQQTLVYKSRYNRQMISRSQSHPLATDEAEYSKYWRGDVTIIEVPETGAKDSITEPTLDDMMTTSAISRSIMAGNNQLVLECLKQGEDRHLKCSKTGRTFFHLVASAASVDHELKWVPMVYQLSNAGVDLDARDLEGQTAVRIAIKRRLVQVLAALLKCGAQFDTGDEYHAEHVTGVIKSEMMEVIRRLTPSYWSAIDDFTSFKVGRLIKAWARINISRNGLTLIEYAKQKAREPNLVKLLVSNEASIELAHAVMAGDADRVKFLLCDSAADLMTSDTSVKGNCFEDFSPLTLPGAAIKYQHTDILKVLEEACKSSRPAILKANSNSDSYRAKVDDRTPSVVNLHSGQCTSTSSLISNAIYNGSSNVVVTSAMCTIL